MDANLRPASVTQGSAPLPDRPDSPGTPDPIELADRAARLRADCQLRDALAAQGFAGPAYAVFEEDLVSYGHRVMTAWLLPPRQREALVLRYDGDMSEAQIAAVMGISRGAVKRHTARATSALRSVLERET